MEPRMGLDRRLANAALDPRWLRARRSRAARFASHSDRPANVPQKKPAPFAGRRNGLNKLVGAEGIEPPTFAL